MAYELEEIKKLAAKGMPKDDFNIHEQVIFYTYRYCYRAYKENPTESTRKRLEEFVAPVVKFHYGRKDY